MKDTLTQLQISMQDNLEAHSEVAMTTATMTTNLDQNSNSKFGFSWLILIRIAIVISFFEKQF